MRPWLEIAKQGLPVFVTWVHDLRGTRRRPVAERALLALAALTVALMLTAGGSARAADDGADPLAGLLAQNTPVICRNQTYALCAGASCFVYNNVAYCGCDVLSGDSLSRPLSYDNSNVCTVNAQGPSNGFVVSTFSLPASIIAPSGNQALYTCPPSASTGAYATCDGGICFTSTQGQSFPGLGQLGKNQIVCSCPITTADSAAAPLGHQIFGPYPCQASFFQNCTSAVANTNNGTTLYAGAPTGSVRLNTLLLTGTAPRFNTCLPP